MTAAEKVEFCREWYAKGVCPGCGAPLEKVAGQGLRHYLGDQIVFGGSNRRKGRRAIDHTRYLTDAGDVIKEIGTGNENDPRLCPWLPDDLTSLVLIGSGTVAA